MKKIIFTLSILWISAQITAQICVGEQGILQWKCWQGLFDDEFSELYAQQHYPDKPDLIQNIYKLEAPLNFDNYIGGTIEGFLTVPNSGDIIFNLTGDDKANFFLSTSEAPEDTVKIVYIDDWTSYGEHNKYASQTSETISLTAGQYYYFKLEYVERTGGDHATIWWQTDFNNTTNWETINSQYLFNIGCTNDPCPEILTPCDDNDANTINDIEDGFCNCSGTPMTTNNCIGPQSNVTSYIYENIPGSNLNDLYESPNYPSIPSTSENYTQVFGRDYFNAIDEIGQVMQAYITVPVSGNYKFNITADNQAILFISSDESIENKQTHQALTTGTVGMTQHDQYIWQSTGNIYLNKGSYYYIEMNHKESASSEHFNIYWQTPFTDGDQWKRIPMHYFYNYECSLACIPENTPCDDGNIFTNNDMYNDNCECVGTPCSGPDCDNPLASYIPFDKCDITSQLDNNESANWTSCNIAPNPNSIYDDGHWLMYDFGESLNILTSQVWNYNEISNLNYGIESVSVDYSNDGITWENLGAFMWPLANGSGNYGGFVGPDFENIKTRYILLTSLDDVNSTPCKGISKISFQAVKCPNEGTLCDDNDENTIGDKFDDNCNCIGRDPFINYCDQDTLILSNGVITSDNYNAIKLVNSTSLVDSVALTSFLANQEIELEAGFETLDGADFSALIEACYQGSIQEQLDKRTSLMLENDSEFLSILQDPKSSDIIVSYQVPKPTEIKLFLYDQNGNKDRLIFAHNHSSEGVFFKRIRTTKLEDKIYQIVYVMNNKKYNKLFEPRQNVRENHK